MYDVRQSLQDLYKSNDLTVGDRYTDSMHRALGPALAYGTPAMYGITATVLSSRKLVAYNLVQNSVDEAKGAARIQVIADRYAADMPLYKKMHRHVGEELKHSRLFAELVSVTGYELIQDEADPVGAEEVLDFDDELRAFICRVHSIEIRSWTVLRMYQDILEHGRFPELSDAALPVLADIMQDEINHVLYTGVQVDEWLAQDPSLQATLDECFAHTNRETWQDMSSMMGWLASNYPASLETDGLIDMPQMRFLVGDLAPPATLI